MNPRHSPLIRLLPPLLLWSGLTACKGDGDKAPDAAPPPAPPQVDLVAPDAPPPGTAADVPPTPTARLNPDAEPLKVVVSTPRGEVRGTIRPTITFDRPVKALGALGAREAPVAEISPTLEGRWRWLGSTTVEFEPTEQPPLSTAYTVRVKSGLVALDGGALAEDHVFTFETPRIRPLRGDPVSSWRAWRWVAPDQEFSVTFNQRPTLDDIREDVLFRSTDGVETAARPVDITDWADKRIAEAETRGETLTEVDKSRFRRDRRAVVRFKPMRPLIRDKDYNLVFRAGLGSAAGPLTAPETVMWSFRTYGPMSATVGPCPRWMGGCPRGPLHLELANPAKAAALRAHLEIRPEVRIDWPEEAEAQRSSWTLFGDFAPETTYHVEVKAGLEDIFGQALAEPFTGEMRTGSFTPSSDIEHNRALVERGQRAAIPMLHVNVPAVNLDWARLTPEDFLPFFLEPWTDWKKQGVRSTREVLRFNTPKNVWRRSPVDLDEAFERTGVPGRLAVARVSWRRSGKQESEVSVVQATDLGVYVKVAPVNSRVWVTALQSGKPVSGAAVDLLDRRGRVLASATSEQDGVATLPGVAELPLGEYDRKPGQRMWGPPTLVARVTLGDDVAFATAEDWQLSPYRFGLDSAWADAPPEAEGFVFTDRGIYRPGETMYVKGILRERSLGALKTPAGRTVKVKLDDPEGNVVAEVDGTVSPYGGVDAQFTLPADGRLGHYGVTIRDEATKLSWYTSARMAEYRPPEFLVNVRAHGDARHRGEPFRAVVEGRYLYGGRMAGAEAEWSLTRSTGHFESASHPAYVFGERVWWWSDEHGGMDNERVASGEWTLDDTGDLLVESAAMTTPDDKPAIYTLEATVTDVNRQAVSGRKAFRVHPAEFYVGLKGPTGFASAGTAFPVDVVAVESAGDHRRADVSVQVKLVRHEWNTVQKKTATGGFETVSEKAEVEVSQCTVSTRADVAVPCSFTAPKSGYHELVATAKDSSGRTAQTKDGVWVAGEGYAAWLQDDDNRVEVVADKGTYDVGETATLLVQSPFPEAEAWVTVEREGVMHEQRLLLKGTATPIKVPIDATMIPNVFVSVVLVRGRAGQPGQGDGDPGRPTFRTGYRELRVLQSEKRLAVKVSPDAPVKRPGDPVSISVAVTDRTNKPARAEVTVWAVDEGVLSLTAYKTPDPLDGLYRRRGLSLRQSTNLLALVPQLRYGEKGKPQGGGGGTGGANDIRSNFVTTPIFIGSTVTDAEGRAQVQGKLPDNLTTFRLMAVAIDATDRGGHGESKVTVNKPLMARPALPRAARVGDRFAAGLIADTLQEGGIDVTVTATASGPVKLLEGQARTVRVTPGKGTEVRFPFDATGEGEARLVFKVEGGGLSDAVEARIPVSLPTIPETVATYGDVADGKSISESLATPGGVRPDVGGLTVTLASSALVGVEADAQKLVEYPYGCLEQQSSRLVPFVALKSLLEEHGEAWLGTRDPKQVVDTTVRKILAMQTGDGGFAYWPGGSCAHYFGSAYATLALGEAKKAGYAVPEQQLERARRYLRERWDGGGCGWWRRNDEERAFGAYVLARQGASAPELGRRLYARRNGMALFSRAMLARTLALDGSRARAQTVVEELMNNARVTARGVRLEESDPDTYAPLFHSDIRSTALGLQALTAVQPDHPYAPKMARAIVTARAGGTWRTTQEAAFSLMALADYVQAREAEAPELVARVKLAGKEIVSERFSGRSLRTTTKTLAWQSLLPADPATAEPTQRLKFSADGTGRTYYGARLRYAPVEMPTQARDEGLVVQRWYERAGAEGATVSVTEGDLVRVRLRLATSQNRHYVVLDDPLPAGLEAVDTSLETAARNTLSSMEGNRSADDSGRGVWYSPFSHTEIRDDRVLLFADRLPPGVHTFEYVARATTAGTFKRPPAHAEEMYTPEVFGRSDGGTFYVHPRATVGAR